MYETHKLPISLKGILFEDGKVWLRKNQRNEWELPGGKLDKDEQPQEAVVRELEEELGMKTAVKDIIQSDLYKIKGSPDEESGVLVISFLCGILSKEGEMETEWEEGRAEFQKFSLEEMQKLNMPNFYKRAIYKAWKMQ
jgi:8-oxo-dGTP pyrophosphatase MutT (NUDIX family)